jgi:hypothetical protein
MMKRVEIFLYADKDSTNPDRIGGLVPFRVNDKQIFFGPDQTPFRKDMRDRFMTYKDDISPEVELYMIGVNDLPKGAGTRKILWVGRINRFMTFEVASYLLNEPEFESLRNVTIGGHPGKNMSPLHLEPIVMLRKTVGYRHRSDYHGKVGRDGFPDWAKDVVEPNFKKDITIADKEIYIEDASNRKNILKRDCCFLCDNLFFADGKGLDFPDPVIALLSEWQPGQDVDNPGIFGYSKARDGSREMNKPKAKPMHIRWQIAERIMDNLLNHL